jgi:hypothetical protein
MTTASEARESKAQSGEHSGEAVEERDLLERLFAMTCPSLSEEEVKEAAESICVDN